MADPPSNWRSERFSLRSKGFARWIWIPWLLVPVLLWYSFRDAPFHQIWSTLRGISAWQMTGFFLFNLVVIFLFALRWQLVVSSFGSHVSLFKMLGFRLAGFGVSYFTPGPQFGGEPLQVLLLHRRAAVPSATAVASVVFDKLIELLSNFTFLAVGLAVAGLSGFVVSRVNGVGLIGVAALLILPGIHLIALWNGRRPVSAALTWIRRRWAWHRFVTVERSVNQVEDQIGSFCRERPLALVKLAVISSLIWLFTLLEFRWMLSILGVSISLPAQIALMVTLRLAFLLPLPAGLGVMEAALVIAGQVVGVSPAEALSAALLIRARDISLGLIGLWVGGSALVSGKRPLENA